MSHRVPSHIIEPLTAGPSASRIAQVASMQNYIQSLLGGTHYTFLQGSYRNDTAISDINDVDIVAVRLNTYSGSYSSVQLDRTVLWSDIFLEIQNKLQAQSRYNWVVQPGDKCIKIKGAFNADVVPAVQIGRDHSFDPIAIYSFREQAEKMSHPRIHWDNGVAKNKVTKDIYKPTVRMFKNWKMNHFGDEKKIISSHKIEALVHSSANDNFVNDPVAAFILTADSILERLGGSGLGQIIPPPIMSVCGKHNICENWDYFDRTKFVEKLGQSRLEAYAAYKAPSQAEAERNWRLAFKN